MNSRKSSHRHGGHVPNKAQFVELLAERLDGDKKKAQAALDAVIDTIYQAVSRGERVVLTGFGVFEKRERKARTARNPATGATVKVKKTSVPAKKAVAKATPTRYAPAKRAPAKKSAAKSSPAKKTTAKKTAA